LREITPRFYALDSATFNDAFGQILFYWALILVLPEFARYMNPNLENELPINKTRENSIVDASNY